MMATKLSVSWLITIGSVIGLAFGIALVLVPAELLGIYGLHPDATGLLLARIGGAEFVGYNTIGWLARESDPGHAHSASRLVVYAHALSETIGAVVCTAVAAQGLGNALLWSVAALYAILAIAFIWAAFGVRELRTAESSLS
jgi:hypothetical protein